MGGCGDGSTTNRLNPILIPNTLFSSSTFSLFLGSAHACILTSTGKIICWGNNA